jgi:hypothetical protein
MATLANRLNMSSVSRRTDSPKPAHSTNLETANSKKKDPTANRNYPAGVQENTLILAPCRERHVFRFKMESLLITLVSAGAPLQ